MSFQLPVPSDDQQFERLIRDILRRDYDDKGVERFGRSGQSQFGIDGIIPTAPEIVFQCKLKDVIHKDDNEIRSNLLTEIEKELEKTEGSTYKPERFIFASTFKNDTHLQEKARSLSNDSLTVEYWGWDTISEKVWHYAVELIPVYYPQFPVREVPGFRPVTPELIAEYQNIKPEELNNFAVDYYKINNSFKAVFRAVCNDIDVRNESVMNYLYRRLNALPPNSTLWLLGKGGSGKTTILHRLAFELTELERTVYLLDLEYNLSKEDLDIVLSCLKFASVSRPTVLCVDNPAADEKNLEQLLRRINEYCPEIHILFAERDHRYRTLKRTETLTYLQGEEEENPVNVHNPADQRQKVYHRLFDLLGVSEADRAPLLNIALNETVVYVNATYSILLELKRQRKIIFDFDWDDYLTMTRDLSAYRECYKYIALFYLFGVKTPLTLLSKISGADEAQQRRFVEKFRGLLNEPVILEERRDETYRMNVHVRTKHEIVSEIYFREHSDIDKTELLMELCEKTDFTNASETQALINIFGAKKNFTDEDSHVNFLELINFLLRGYINEQVALSPKLNATLNLAIFWIQIIQGKTAKATEALETFLEKVPDDFHCRTELAKIYQKEGKLDKAETVLTKILDIKPRDLNSRTELAKIYQRQGKLREAEILLTEVIDIKPNDLNSRTELAKIYQRQNKILEAETILLKILELDKHNLQARTELAKIYQRQGKLDQAETVLLKILDIKAKDLQSRTELAKIYQRQGRWEEAIKRLEEYIELDPKGLHPRTELAKIYQRQGRWEEAIKRLEEYIELDPKGLHPRTELAKIYRRQNKLDQAEAVLLELLELNTNNLQARTELAKIYQRQNKLDKAEAVLMESLEIDSKQLHPRTELAKIYQRQGRWNEAEKRLDEILEINPLNDFAVSELLAIWKQQKEKEKCVQRFFQFIDQPNYRFSRYSQAPVFRFFQCCRAFDLGEYAGQVFERFESELDEMNVSYYENNFNKRR